MAITFIQGGGTQSSGSVSSVAKTLSSSVTVGNFLAVGCVSSHTTITNGNVTDNLGNTYTLDRREASTGGSPEVAIFYSVITHGGTCTITFDCGSDYMDIGVAEFSGVDATSPTDTGSSGHATSTAPATGNYVTSVNGVIVALLGHNSDTTPITEPSGYTLIYENEDGNNMAFNWSYVISTAGSHTSTWGTFSTSKSWAVVASNFIDSGGTPPPVTGQPLWLRGIGVPGHSQWQPSRRF